MNFADELRERMRFIRLDDDMRTLLREMRPTIARILPTVLDEFYRHVASHPETARLFTNAEHMRRAKEMQLKHWDTIAAANFDATYVSAVTRIGRAHQKIGLEPRWYIGGYSFLLAALLRGILSEWERPGAWFGAKARAVAEKRARMVTALTTAALLDMDLAISVYLDFGLRAKQETIERIGASFTHSVSAMSSQSNELEATARTLTQTAETGQSLAAAVASASEEASTNVQAVAAAAEELAASINEVSRQVQQSTTIAADAVRQASKADGRINELSQAAQRIGEVVNLITAIAEQTNLLALNATIEAARAGEAGRGFAVVAQEVKALAAQTAKATSEITAQIANVQNATLDTVGAIKDIGATIERMSQIAATIASAVEQQGAATRQIAYNVQQAAKGATQVAESIVQVSKVAMDTGSASNQLLSSARLLAGESNRLKEEAENFLRTVRAA